MSHVEFQPSSANLVLHPVAEKKEMLSLRKLEDGRTNVKINASSLSVIQECLAKSKMSLLDGWRAEAESPATLFGKAIHSALEVFYSTKPDERTLPDFDVLEMLSYGHAPKEETPLIRSAKAFLAAGAALSPLPAEDKRSLQNGIWLLHEYFKKFRDDPYTAYVDDRGPFLERYFSLPYYSDSHLNVEIFGTIDFVLEHTVTKELLPGDHKTASSLTFGDSSYFDREKPNHQYTMYSYAVNKFFGLKAEDFLVNVFEVKAKPKTARGSGPSFPRQITKRTEEDFVELQDVILEAVDRIVWAAERNRFPMGSVDACNKYGGCQFKQVCASPRAVRETILSNKFTRK